MAHSIEVANVRAAVLLVAFGCSSRPDAPRIPAPRGNVPATFASEAELRDYLAAAGRAREPVEIERQRISEADGDWEHVHVEPRVAPFLEVRSDTAVAKGAAMLVDGDSVWVTHERGVSRAVLRTDALPATAERFDQPRDAKGVVPDSLLVLPDGVVAMVRNDCGGIDVASVPFTATTDDRLRLCGTLIGTPLIARAGDRTIVYAAFDAIGDPDLGKVRDAAEDRRSPPSQPAPTIPTLRERGGRAARSIVELGPVHYPSARDADVIVRIVAQCDAALARCKTRAFVSPRSAIDALWIDARRLAFGFAHRHGHSTIIQLGHDGGEPQLTALDRWVIGLAARSDGRLAVVRSSRAVRHPSSPTTPLVGAIDEHGRVESGPTLPAPVTGRDGSWHWRLHRDRLVYGPTRTHNLGGADTPRVFVAPTAAGAVDARTIGPSVDAILVAGDDAILVGATSKGVDTIVRRPLAATGSSWTEHAYDGAWSLQTPGFEQASRARLYEIGERRLVVVPYPDRTYVARYELRVLELRETGVVELARFPVPSGTGGQGRLSYEDDRLDGLVVGERLVLRAPSELVVVDLTRDAATIAGRIAL